jgi:multidrug transporter EmrE-like cation transporter
MFLYFSLTGSQFIVSFIASVATWKINYFWNFVLDHDNLLMDLMIYSALNAFSVMFVYKLINIFRQHVYPIVSTTRKCFTVCINVAYYGHHLAPLQWFSILLVFGGVFIEIINNYNLA